MASKRSRATFEADLQAQQSPYVIYGTPLPPLDPEVRDDGSYVPVWKQEVTDERGRKRLHGAFTGGFSAGYFNTVGSKEGWTPSTFVSSRSDRNKDGPKQQQRREDFMDEEDLAEAEEAKALQTTEAFAGLGSASDVTKTRDRFMDLLRPTGETMGVKLLKKMGWREGQGIGPKVRRAAKLEDGQQATAGDTHLFAPENSQMISFIRKTDRRGVGFEGEERLTKATQPEQVMDRSQSQQDDEENPTFVSQIIGSKGRKKKVGSKSGFGVGILNDNGSDEEDLYAIGPQISYNRILGGDKKKKTKPEVTKSAANPLLNSKPIFISKKTGSAKADRGFRRCHDGRLPIEGFTLPTATDALASILLKENRYPGPKIPSGWKSTKTTVIADPGSNSQPTQLQSAQLNPSSRAALLGEKPLPSKSVFDFLTPAARSRIATATSNEALPPARSEAANNPLSTQKRDLHSLIPALPKETALAALGRGTGGWLPYADTPDKRARYINFLEHIGGLQGEAAGLPDRASGVNNDDWAKEMQEFAHAATIFKPMSGAMASRFMSSTSSSGPKTVDTSVTGQGNDQGKETLLRQAKGKTPAEEAAALGMYGHLTRGVDNWFPTRLLCKRFNVKPPTHVPVDPGENPTRASGDTGVPTYSTAMPQKRLELVGKREMDELKMGGGIRSRGFTSGGVEGGSETEGVGEKESERNAKVAIDPERNEAIEKERPGEAVFRAIFGSDSEDD